MFSDITRLLGSQLNSIYKINSSNNFNQNIYYMCVFVYIYESNSTEFSRNKHDSRQGKLIYEFVVGTLYT